jgi:hypothetical protein
MIRENKMIREHLSHELKLITEEPTTTLRFKPGDVVMPVASLTKGHGIVLSTSDDGFNVTVIWSEYDDPASRILRGFAAPLVRRVFPGLIANQIVSVQPMTAPTGNIFYLDHVYGSGSKKEEK